MPFGSYQESPAQAFRNAARIMAETGAAGVKLEGGTAMAETIHFLVERGVPVLGIGKIHDIYHGRGLANYVTTRSNADGMEKITAALAAHPRGLIFANLVDFDMLYGHRKDVEGFARSLEEFDVWLGSLVPRIGASDLLLLTADHGCDPCPCSPSTDHSREYVPILAYTPERPAGRDLGTRETLADMGQTVAEIFGGKIPHGRSFLEMVCGL